VTGKGWGVSRLAPRRNQNYQVRFQAAKHALPLWRCRRARTWRARRCRSISAYLTAVPYEDGQSIGRRLAIAKSIDRGTNAGSGEKPGLPKGRCKPPWNVPINGRCSEVALSTSRTCFSTDYNWLVRLIYIKATATGMLYCQQMGTRSCGVKRLEMSLVDFCQFYGHGCSVFGGIAITANAGSVVSVRGGPPVARAISGPTGSCESPTRELAASRQLNQDGTQQCILRTVLVAASASDYRTTTVKARYCCGSNDQLARNIP
jgi:hypothetical protein